MVRLLAVVLAVAGAGAVGARAPQALRAWTDTAAEVARAGQSRRVDEAAPGPGDRRPGADRKPVRPGRTPAARPAARTSHAWPAAGDLRQLLALKQSRLILNGAAAVRFGRA